MCTYTTRTCTLLSWKPTTGSPKERVKGIGAEATGLVAMVDRMATGGTVSAKQKMRERERERERARERQRERERERERFGGGQGGNAGP